MSINQRVLIIDNKICIPTKELLSMLKIAQQTLSDWKQDGCPQVQRGWWSIADVLEWRGLVSSSGIVTNEDIEELSVKRQKEIWEARYKKLQSEKLEISNAIDRGDYIPKTEVVSEFQRLLVILKKSNLSLASKLAARMGDYLDVAETRKIKGILKTDIENFLEQVSVDGKYTKPRK